MVCYYVDSLAYVNPILYLNSKVYILDGDGSKDNLYILQNNLEEDNYNEDNK